MIAEFNTFGSPTSKQARKEMSDMLGVDWTGWIGRYYLDLSQGSEIPNWAVKTTLSNMMHLGPLKDQGSYLYMNQGKLLYSEKALKPVNLVVVLSLMRVVLWN